MYAFLKRLGYVLFRARVHSPPTSPPAVPLSLLQRLFTPLQILRIFIAHIPKAFRLLLPLSYRQSQEGLYPTRRLSPNEGRFSDLLGGSRWGTFGSFTLPLPPA